MSFQIEYTGSLVNNRNVPQVSAVSSMTRQTTGPLVNTAPSLFEFNGSGSVPFINGLLFVEGNGLIYNAFSVNPITIQGDGNCTFVGEAGFVGSSWFFQFQVPLGSTTAELQYLLTDVAGSGVGNFASYYNNFGPGGGTGNTSNFPATSSPITFNFPSNTNYVLIEFFPSPSVAQGATVSFRLDYIRFRTASVVNLPIDITPSTLTEGAQKVGGTPTAITVNTVQDGASAVSGPAKLFGVEVKDGGVTKAKAKYLPAADNTEEAVADVKDVKIITADNTSLTVEATGLGGPEKLQSGTSIVVEDMTEQTENP